MSDQSLVMYTPEELMARLTENPEERLMVYAPDALSALETFDERCSGRATNRGVRYIKDEAAAARYAEVQTRMIPLIGDPADWTKVEYLGYVNCALQVREGDYSSEQLDALLKTVRPKAAVLFGEFDNPDFTRVLGQVGFLYAHDPATVLDRMKAALSPLIDGFVTRAGSRAASRAVVSLGGMRE
jgi:hypothetical protein